MEKFHLITTSYDSAEMTQIVECLEDKGIPVLIEHIMAFDSLDHSPDSQNEGYRILVAEDCCQKALDILLELKQARLRQSAYVAENSQESHYIH